MIVSRRSLIAGGGALLSLGTGALILRNGIGSVETYRPLLRVGEAVNFRMQRLALGDGSLAPEYRSDQISSAHPSRGGMGAPYIDPDPHYFEQARDGFPDWRLTVTGFVKRPLRLALDQILTMPSRSQITMHSCDEGWSAIAKWSGVPLSFILTLAGALPSTRYVVFRCMDKFHMWTAPSCKG